MKLWKLAEAKNKFSEVVRLALTKGPQRIVRRDDSVIVISDNDYEKLTGKRQGLKDLLLNGPGLEDLDLGRDQSPMRDFEI
jgi:prevent-host-death family protein